MIPEVLVEAILELKSWEFFENSPVGFIECLLVFFSCVLGCSWNMHSDPMRTLGDARATPLSSFCRVFVKTFVDVLLILHTYRQLPKASISQPAFIAFIIGCAVTELQHHIEKINNNRARAKYLINNDDGDGNISKVS
jgi:glucose uptake protein GlcU